MDMSCSGKWFPIDLSYYAFDYLVVCKGAMHASMQERKCASMQVYKQVRKYTCMKYAGIKV